MKANCPSCGAEVQFKSSISVFSVCDYCKSMIVRHDMDLESLGKTAQLPDDVSPLKIGSRGKYNNASFEVIGRLKVAWSEGYWNEWFILFDDGKHIWLAEAMGFFMLSSEVQQADKIPHLSKIKIGSRYELIPSHMYSADDIKEAVCIGSEGELPFKGLSGRKSTSVDLSNPSGEFACIEYSKQDGSRLFIGKYVEFKNLSLTNLRDLSQDIKKIRGSELFKCPSCGGSMSLLTPGLTASVACRYCGSIIDATHRSLQILSKAEKKMHIKPLIPMGSKGKIFEIEWEAIGFMRRSDKTGQYLWDEYLLFNPTGGFRWLTTYNGHWNFVETMRTQPADYRADADVKFLGKTFKKYLVGKAKVVYVLGEFYWRVRNGDTVNVADFISPPEILSRESEKSEAVWSHGRYIEPEEIAKAFKISEQAMPEKTGVAPNQPSPNKRTAQISMLIFLGLSILITLMQLFFVSTAYDSEIYRGDFTVNPAEPPKSLLSPSFEVPGGMSNIEVNLYSPVSNDWMETAVELVDEKTNNSIASEIGVEYYSGVDSDGAWSEGSVKSNHALSSVPEGRYHLLIYPAAASGSPEKKFTITLRRGVVIWSNYFLALLLLAAYPLYACWRSSRFERDRWSDSDLSPYNGEE